MIGQTLSHYQITEKLGEGGMGEVYRAEDTILGRQVAIKVLPDIFAGDPERLARFEREAKLLASLNHPNIATIHGLEQPDGKRFLVMEMVEGATLADRIARGPISLGEALPIGKQIAEALEYAHEKGIIHRDLKPANIKITPEDKVKVLDFGLAKAVEEAPAVADAANSPTLSLASTKAGIILGTAAYMAPEQARGKPVDRRADIWAFGAVLYEMLTGRRAFRGDDVSETLAAVITAEPDWGALGIGVPPSVHRLLRRCLQKDPRNRLSAIADARLEVEEALAPASTAEVAGKGTQPATWWRALQWTLAGVLAIALISVYLIRQPSQAVSVPMHIPLVMSSDNSMKIYSPAISPDGSMIAFGASTSQGSSLYLRRLDEWEAHPLAGTQDGDSPFFSPDGQWIAFRRNGNGALEKISVSGGPSQVVCKDEGFQGRWLKDGRIVFGRWPQVGLWQVSSSGGAAELIIKPPEVSEGSRYLEPQFLPDSRGMLFTIWNQEQTSIAVLPAGADKPRILVESGSSPRYLPTGHLVYVAGNRLFAVQFDLERSVLRGETIAVADDVNESVLWTSDYDVSLNGTLVFLPASTTASNVVWKNRQGQTLEVVAASRQFEFPSLSPNGQRLSVAVREGPVRHIWTAGTSNEPLTRLTFGNDDWYGVFSPDGKRLFYLAGQAGRYNNFAISTDGSGKAERLTQSPHPQAPTSVSPAGDVVLYNEIDPSTGADIWALSLQSGKTWPVVQTRYTEYSASFSPDGKWIAYASNESGKYEVYVQAYPGPGLKKRISLEGGRQPFWSHSEREIFYRTTKALFAVPVLDSRDLRLGTPHLLFPLPKGGDYGFNIISADDQRFLMLEDSGLTVQLNLVLGWFEELKRLAPTK